MKHSQHAKAAWLDRSGCPDGPPQLHVRSDQMRAPISFGWWAMTAGERISKYWHVQTLYRLESRRIDDTTTSLVASSFYGMTAEGARAHLVSRQNALLPKLPAGYRWIGPTLIEDTASEPRIVHHGEPVHRRAASLLQARELAANVLRARSAAAVAIGAVA